MAPKSVVDLMSMMYPLQRRDAWDAVDLAGTGMPSRRGHSGKVGVVAEADASNSTPNSWLATKHISTKL